MLEHLAAVFSGDGMGFRTATLIAPEGPREYSLPRHREFAETGHESERFNFLRGCGNVEA